MTPDRIEAIRAKCRALGLDELQAAVACLAVEATEPPPKPKVFRPASPVTLAKRALAKAEKEARARKRR